jgi:DMSO/TMAO reductase YedYZ molybdopterin-dependent catalytic subunit
MSTIIISPDTRRGERLPPGQSRTAKWPVLHEGPVPPFDTGSWDLTVFPRPLVTAVQRFTWAEFLALPRVAVMADMHCVTRWSRLDNLWEGVATRELLKHVHIDDAAKFVMVHAEHGYSANMPLDEFFNDDCLFALKHDGKDLEPDHGGPLRLVVPQLYAWKSVKWVRGIEFMAEDHPGFWERPENGSYHMHGDPWREQRHSPHS